MIGEALLVAGLAIALGAIWYSWRNLRVREVALRRLDEPVAEEPAVPVRRERQFVQRYWVVPWLLGVLVGLVLYFFPGLPVVFCVTLGLIVALLGGELDQYRVELVTRKIEEQLADALDLMVASLRAGAGAMSALETAAHEARWPLREQIDQVPARIRYGDDPALVLRALEARVPLETFRLFSSALSVHWETGGSLAPTLATVGRVIRDRIEVRRRIGSLTTQGRVSIAVILVVTYFIAFIFWRNDPDRMRRFLATTAGEYLVAGAILLQAVGIVWSAALSRLRF